MKKAITLILCALLIFQLSACTFFGKDIFGSFFNFGNTGLSESARDDMRDPYYSENKRNFAPPTNAGISEEHFQQKLQDVSKDGPAESHYGKVIQMNGYRSLKTDCEKKIYSDLGQAVYRVSSEKNDLEYYPVQKITITKENVSEDIIRKVIGLFSDDHPSVFWIANTFGYTYSGEDTFIQLYSVISPSDCNDAIGKVLTRINAVLQDIPEGLTEYEREYYIHKWLVENCSYDKQAISSKNKWSSFNIYGAIVLGESVCEGYSKSMQVLLNNVGIYCRLISGDARNTPHMWNLVLINNNWYHLDATWNDASDIKRFDYFNVPDNIISVDHKIYKDFGSLTKEQICGTDNTAAQMYNVDLPACFAMGANYFNVEAVKISSFNKESDRVAIKALYEAASKEDDTISFLISSNLNYESTVSKMFLGTPHKFLYYLEEVNDMLTDKRKLDPNNISFSKVESQNAVTVKLSYAK